MCGVLSGVLRGPKRDLSEKTRVALHATALLSQSVKNRLESSRAFRHYTGNSSVKLSVRRSPAGDAGCHHERSGLVLEIGDREVSIRLVLSSVQRQTVVARSG